MALSEGRAGALEPILPHIPGGKRRSRELVPFSINDMDFEVLDLTEASMASYAGALAYSATLDPIQTFDPYLGFAKATQEWLTHNTDQQRGRGARERVRSAVAEVLGVIATARVDRGFAPLDPSDRMLLQHLAAIGYGDVINQALSHVPTERGARVAAATNALKQFQGNPNEPSQGAAFELILASLDDSASAKTLVDAVVAAFVQSGGVPNSYYTRFLIAAADQRALSVGLVDQLVGTARVALSKEVTDFEDSELARILAHAMSQIPPADRPVAIALIDRAAKTVSPMSMMTAEMYAALGRQQLDQPGMLGKVEEQAHKAKPYSPADPSTVVGPGTGVEIVVGSGPWLVALAEYGRTRQLPARDLALLREHIANPSLRDLLVPALARQESVEPVDTVVGSWVGRLAALRLDARARGVEQAIIAGALAARPRMEFDLLIERLRTARADTREPELRIALGAIIVEAQIGRARGCLDATSYARECTLPAF